MIPLDEARTRMLAALAPCPAVTLPLEQACGRILAGPMIAQCTQPPVALSAMDGYAVRSADLATVPARLKLVGEAAAGHAFDGRLDAGMAVRISTGAPLPGGADQVVMQERAVREADAVVLDDTQRPGANVRPAGTDFSSGEALLPAGRRVTPEALALAAAARLEGVTVHPRPRVGVLASGDELVEPGEPAGPSQIVNSVSPGLAGMVRAWGGEPVYLGIARDDAQDVRRHVASARGLDLLVTVGGASVGDHDHFRRVFAERGGQLAFEKVAVRPGKPTWFGVLDDLPCLGLPGNPVSALVIARLLLRPAMARLEGHAVETVFERADLGAALPANGPREAYLRARRDAAGRVVPLENQDSSALSALVQADCLIRRPVDADPAEPGDTADILPLDGRG